MHGHPRLAGAHAKRAARAPFLASLESVASLLAVACLALAGCTPAIGDKCTISTDCSIQGTRFCDPSQTAGYCTVMGCMSNNCPDNAVCVEFGARVPGCPYDDYQAPSRTGQSMCMKACSSDSDCREQDGYGCRDPTGTPYGGVLLDTMRSNKVCIQVTSVAPPPVDAAMDDDVVTVCSWNLPPLPAAAGGDGGDAGGEGDGSSAPDAEDGALADRGAPDGGDARASDAAIDGSDGGAPDATVDGGDAGAPDATVDGGDAGAFDATIDDGGASGEGAAGDASLDDAAADGTPDAGAFDAADGD